jgi:branched-subunit amino acid permease
MNFINDIDLISCTGRHVDNLFPDFPYVVYAVVRCGINFHDIGQASIPVLSSEYTDSVKLNILVPAGQMLSFTKKITELTNGSVNPEEIKQVYFTTLNNEVYLFV